MLALITSYWFITLPTVVTSAYLLRVWKKALAHKEKQIRLERVHVRSRRNQYPRHPQQ